VTSILDCFLRAPLLAKLSGEARSPARARAANRGDRVPPGPPSEEKRDWADSILGHFTHAHPFQSSSLSSARYNHTSRVLEVTFQGGSQYLYKDVPPSLWRGLRRAKSKGKYLHQKVKRPGYAFRRIKGPEEEKTAALFGFPTPKHASVLLPDSFFALRFFKQSGAQKILGLPNPLKMSPAQMAAEKLQGGLVKVRPKKGINLPKMQLADQVPVKSPGANLNEMFSSSGVSRAS
jgi:hypothetical protein